MAGGDVLGEWLPLGPEYFQRHVVSLLPWSEGDVDLALACLAPFGAVMALARRPPSAAPISLPPERLRAAPRGRTADLRLYDAAGRGIAKADLGTDAPLVGIGWVAVGANDGDAEEAAILPPVVLLAVHEDGRVRARDPAGRIVPELAFSFGDTAKEEGVCAACFYHNRGGLGAGPRHEPGAAVTGGAFAVTNSGTVLLVEDLHRPQVTRVGAVDLPADWPPPWSPEDGAGNPFGNGSSPVSPQFTVLAHVAIPPAQTSHGRPELHMSLAPSGDAPDMPTRAVYVACDPSVGACVDQRLPERFGCVVRIAVSPGGNLLALANSEGAMHVATSDLRSYVSESDVSRAGPRPVPDLVLWCGSDAVALAWHGSCGGGEEAPEVVLVGPAGDHVSVLVGSSFGPRSYGIAGVTEVDGTRFVCGNEHVFLRRVPAALRQCLEPGSAAPGALLLDAVQQLDAPTASGGGAVAAAASLEAAAGGDAGRDASADENDSLRAGAHLAPASAQCLAAATASLDSALQRRLLRAATFGAALCGKRPAMASDSASVAEAARAAAAAAADAGSDAAAAAQAAAAAARDPCADLPRGAVADACDAAWALNAMRSGGGGSGAGTPRVCPTHAQLSALGPDALCLLLCHLGMHAEAAAGCHVLRARRGTLRHVLVVWSRRVLETSQNETDGEVLQRLLACLAASPLARASHPFVGAAAACRDAGRPAVAASLLRLVPRCRDRVPLLLGTGSSKAALDEALRFGDGALIGSCLSELKRRAERDVKLVEFFGLLAARPVARRMLAASLRASCAAAVDRGTSSSVDALAEAESARELLSSLHLHAGDHGSAADDAWRDGAAAARRVKDAVGVGARREQSAVAGRSFVNAKRLYMEAASGSSSASSGGDAAHAHHPPAPDHLLEQAAASASPLDGKEASWRASMCELHAKLLSVQAEMEGVDAVGLSVLDTIKLLFATGNPRQAVKLKSDFSVGDKSFAWARLRGHASSKDWAGVEKFARENPRKPGGIGHDAFVEVCFEFGAPREALIPHIKRHPSGAARSAAFAKAGMLREAAEEAARAKDAGALARLRDAAPPGAIRNGVEGLLAAVVSSGDK